MRYSLLSRIQGSFLGAAVGEIWAAHASDVASWTEREWERSPLTEFSTPSWGKWAIAQMRCLTSYPSTFAEPPSQPPISSAGLAIALLPLAFFYHEDRDLLNRQIQSRLEQWQLPTEAGLGALMVGYAIHLILREQLQPLDLIPQLLAEMPEARHTPLINQLAQAQEWLVEAAIASQFSTHQLALAAADPAPVGSETTAIALAFYAFLSTPEDFQLSLLRVAQLSGQPLHIRRLACSLTGALSGAYNGRGGLPQDWRQVLRTPPEGRSPLSLLWDVASEFELLDCIHKFVFAWSGMHNPMRGHLRSRELRPVAIPRMIRPV